MTQEWHDSIGRSLNGTLRTRSRGDWTLDVVRVECFDATVRFNMRLGPADVIGGARTFAVCAPLSDIEVEYPQTWRNQLRTYVVGLIDAYRIDFDEDAATTFLCSGADA
jgi:hypothetical protein